MKWNKQFIYRSFPPYYDIRSSQTDYRLLSALGCIHLLLIGWRHFWMRAHRQR